MLMVRLIAASTVMVNLKKLASYEEGRSVAIQPDGEDYKAGSTGAEEGKLYIYRVSL
jgi:hypothetical protein